MILVKCIEKLRDESLHNKIIAYRLIDANNQIKDITAETLKKDIRNCKMQVINLTLTKDGRLVDKKKYKDTLNSEQSFRSSATKLDLEIEKLLAKAKILNAGIHSIETYSGRMCYLISKSNTSHLLLIPSDITSLNGVCKKDTFIFTDMIQQYEGSVHVIGGEGLCETSNMFSYCKFNEIDLTNFNTLNVVYMNNMFHWCSATKIDIGNINTSKVIDMSQMFYNCKVNELDLSSLDTSNVTNMERMFGLCSIKYINLQNFNTSKVINMSGMFYECMAKYINISTFDTSNVKNMKHMFGYCRLNELNLSNFKLNSAKELDNMFFDSHYKKLDLSGVKVPNGTDLYNIFDYTTVDTIYLDDDRLKHEFRHRKMKN